MRSIKVNVNPQVLVWARLESGFSQEDVINRLKLKYQDFVAWESNGLSIPFKKLELIAKIYRRQAAIFFLPSVPEKTNKPDDFRNLAKKSRHFSPDTLLAIRRANRYLKVSRDIFGLNYWQKQYQWKDRFDGRLDHADNEMILLRDFLKAPLTEQVNLRNTDEAFRFWRNKIEEELGIFIFQFQMAEGDLDGFSYAFNDPPFAIVVDSAKQAPRKIFTIFHELVHIFKHKAGVCDIEVDDEKNDFSIELECNKIAGKFLVPRSNLKYTNSLDDIFNFANFFKVSGEVYLRRLKDESLIGEETFFTLLYQVRERSANLPRKKQKGFPSGVILSKSTRGNKLFNIITSAVLESKISFSRASDILGLKIGNMPI